MNEEIKPVGAVLYDILKGMAVDFAFKPQERINEVMLAAQLNVSRTPLREALNRLVAEGFVTTKPQKGFYGRVLDTKSMANLYEFRSYLESSVVELLCRNATEADLAALGVLAEGYNPDTGVDPSPAELLARDEAFHVRMARLTDNLEFAAALESVNERIRFVRGIELRTRGATSHEHVDIVRAISARDVEQSVALVRSHITQHAGHIRDIIHMGIAEIYLSGE